MLRRLGRFRSVAIVSALLWVTVLSGAVPVAQSLKSADSGPRSDPSTFLGVKVLKTEDAGSLKWQVELPRGCPTCRLVMNSFTSGQNPRELYFHLLAPASPDRIANLRIQIDPAKVRGVLVGRAEVPFARTSDGIVFDAPMNGRTLSQLSDDYHILPAYLAGDVTDFYTYIDTPGIELRVEHADEKRRNGPYATGPWPAVERQAALNLEFAARDAAVALKLDRLMRERGLGTIFITGFDTNFPTQGPNVAHGDDPPHWHMHIYWNHEPVVRQVGHIYIGRNGLLTENVVGDPTTDKILTFGRGESHKTVTDAGDVLYTHTITPEGYFLLATSNDSCRLTPILHGFDSGVDVLCEKSGHHSRVKVRDELSSGVLQVAINDRIVEQHSYNSDNGVLKATRIWYDGSGPPLKTLEASRSVLSNR